MSSPRNRTLNRGYAKGFPMVPTGETIFFYIQDKTNNTLPPNNTTYWETTRDPPLTGKDHTKQRVADLVQAPHFPDEDTKAQLY